MAAMLDRLGFRTTPLQSPWVVERLGPKKALTPGEMALLTRDGQLLFGVDAYIHVLEQTSSLRPFAKVARVGWVYGRLRGLYRWIADHRQQISAVCHLKPDLPPNG
jgi:hypothetical protein